MLTCRPEPSPPIRPQLGPILHPILDVPRVSQSPQGSNSVHAGLAECGGRFFFKEILPLSFPQKFLRVRCDLKDISIPVTGPHPACSNCKERGLKCVYVVETMQDSKSFLTCERPVSDEFADVKAVKLLRRGRRLQQVEYVCLLQISYGAHRYC